MCLARVTKIHRPFLPLSKYEKQKGIGQDMSIGNLILVVNSVSVSCLIHYDTLLQNATDGIAKCDRWYCKMRQMVLQNVTDGIAKCDRWYCKMRLLFYYKMRHLLQIATVHQIPNIWSSVRSSSKIRDALGVVQSYIILQFVIWLSILGGIFLFTFQYFSCQYF